METSHREDRLHIGFFGRCNSGKSTLVNIISGQDVSIVSENAGTTTDLVRKTMELHGIGPVVLIDTAGLDDKTELGQKRVRKTLDSFSQLDAAVLVTDGTEITDTERKTVAMAREYSLDIVAVCTKSDLGHLSEKASRYFTRENIPFVTVNKSESDASSKITKLLKDNIRPSSFSARPVLKGIVNKGDFVLLVTPIDSSAPKGRLILPQVKMIREILDEGAMSIVCKETELEMTLEKLPFKPDLVIIDSQVFPYVDRVLDKDIPLTSFSILLAREKGDFGLYLKGTPKLSSLRDGDKVLMLESCSHQPTCEDIGRVKLPNMIRKFTGKDLSFKAVAGIADVEDDVKDYSMVIQCGGCVATPRQLQNRLLPFIKQGIAVSNYGMAIAYMNGIFERSVSIFGGKKPLL